MSTKRGARRSWEELDAFLEGSEAVDRETSATTAGSSRHDPCRHRYTPVDIALLADVDEACGQLSSSATKEFPRRQYEVHGGDMRFKRLTGISSGHIHDLSKTRAYRTGRLTFRRTRPTPVGIGERRKARLPVLPQRLQRPPALERRLFLAISVPPVGIGIHSNLTTCSKTGTTSP